MNNQDSMGASFELLYEKNFSNFKRFAKTYVQQDDIAEDIVVDSFLSYWEHRSDIHQKNIAAYILTAVKNRCLNHLKHLKVRYKAELKLGELQHWETQVKIQTLEACDPVSLLSKELEAIIRDTVDRFPAKTRTVFHMSRFENKTHKEIADFLQISTKAVEYHITQAISRLRAVLQEYLPLFIFYFFHFLF